MKRDPTECQGSVAKASAILVLKELDPGSRIIKAYIFIPKLEAEDELVVETVTEGPEPDVIRYDPRLQLAPIVTKQKAGPWLPVQLPYESQDFLYPFEKHRIDLHVEFKRNKAPVQLKLQVRNNVVDLIAQPCIPHYSFEQAPSEPNSFSLTLQRHRFVRAIAIVLYAVAILFLSYIVRREETSKVLPNSLGYMAALWGIRQIIIGSAKVFPTIVDVLTLFLYVAVASIVVYKWLSVARTSRESGL